MKNLLLLLWIITGLAACKSQSEDSAMQNRNIQLLTDSTAYTNNVYSDTNNTADIERIPVKISPKSIKRTPIVSKSGSKDKSAPLAGQTTSASPEMVPPVATRDSANQKTETTGSGTTASTGGPAAQPAAQKKKGWNKATQGAVIGGVAGAVGGAIISKKKGVGAIVGGIVGAAGGYIIGNKMDKKNPYFAMD